jgi:hypothetical protein
MIKLTLFVITDRREEPKSFMSNDGLWKDLGKNTKFYDKKSNAIVALQYVDLKSADVEEITFTVE